VSVVWCVGLVSLSNSNAHTIAFLTTMNPDEEGQE